MLATRFHIEPWDVDARLVPFGVIRQELFRIVGGVVAARADSVDDDPASAEGSLLIFTELGFCAACFARRAIFSIGRTTSKALNIPIGI